jgi:AcrR family transcriptional regulator
MIENTELELAGATTSEEKVKAFFRAGFRLVANRQNEMTVYLSERFTIDWSAPRWRELEIRRDAYREVFDDILTEGMDSGVFRRLPHPATTLGLLGSISWAYQWFNPKGGQSAEELADLFASISLHGIIRR